MVEQLKALKEDPADVTAAILKSIVAREPTQVPQFTPTSSDIIINTLWSLSLLLSISSALAGLLCKQWIREYRKEVYTHSQAESLSVRWLRKESLARWHVPSIIAALPLLVELSLLLFVAGFLVLLRARHSIPFGFGVTVVGIVCGLYLLTMLLPAFTLARRAWEITRRASSSPLDQLPAIHFTCPYKCPQALITFTFVRSCLGAKMVKHFLYRLSNQPSFSDFQHELERDIQQATDWASQDLHIVRAFDHIEQCPPIYQLQVLRWLVQVFGDTPSMIPPLRRLLVSLPSSLTPLIVQSAFDHWRVPIWMTVSRTDLETALDSSLTTFPDKRLSIGLDTYAVDVGPPINTTQLSQLLFYNFSWSDNTADWRFRLEMTRRLHNDDVPCRLKMPFIVPFHKVEKLWLAVLHGPLRRPNETRPLSDEQRIGEDFFEFYQRGWEIASSLGNAGHRDQLALTKAVAKHIVSPGSETSALLVTRQGVDLIRMIHNGIVDEKLYDNGDWLFSRILQAWMEAVSRLQTIWGPWIGGFKDIPYPP
ncbi:hypothetical protein PM082_019279 [Marasmius tenuissimus]|nr:hypothetical protein PM082_019279 [Marasmius tenuissimus]